MPSADAIRLVVFDCDGTLVDSLHLIAEAMAGAFVAAGLAPPGPERVRRVVGLSLATAVAGLLLTQSKGAAVACGAGLYYGPR